MKAGDQTLVMGDIVLLEDQVNAVMSVALDHGLEVTALHNHFFWDSPKVMFMHIGGNGAMERLAAAVGQVFAKVRETGGGKGEIPHTAVDPAKTSLDPQKIEAIIGAKGELAGGVFKITLRIRKTWLLNRGRILTNFMSAENARSGAINLGN